MNWQNNMEKMTNKIKLYSIFSYVPTEYLQFILRHISSTKIATIYSFQFYLSKTIVIRYKLFHWPVNKIQDIDEVIILEVRQICTK